MEYTRITQYCGKLIPGKWQPEKQTGNGSSENPYVMPYVVFDENVEKFLEDFYALYNSLYDNNDYFQILKDNGIQLDDSLKDMDVKKLEDYVIMNMILAVIRQDRFCEGLLNDFIGSGCIDKWLYELKERDR